MSQAKLFAVLAAIFVLLCAVFFGLYITRDKTDPVISFTQEPLSYEEGQDTSVLLKGVTALDNRDGDITAKIAVDAIIPKSDGRAAVVRYIVKDSAGNITSAMREVIYSGGKPVSGTAIPTPEPKEESSQASTPSPSPSLPPAPSPDSSVPTITLSAKEASTPVGMEFYLLDYVSAVSDDADDQDYLYGHISILGNVDFYTKGIYKISFVVTDSAGNDSLPAEFTVRVE